MSIVISVLSAIVWYTTGPAFRYLLDFSCKTCYSFWSALSQTSYTTPGDHVRFLTYRTPLTERRDPTPIPDFVEFLCAVRAEGTVAAQSFTKRRVQPEHVLEWQARLRQQTYARYLPASPEAELTLGIQTTLVGEFLLKRGARSPIAFDICVDGQQRLTRALMLLTVDDRGTLIRTKDRKLRRCFYGALAVARLAAALTKRGAQVFLPTVDDDRSHGIDLLVKFETSGACVQVKAVGERNFVTLVEDPEAPIVRGVALFNQKYASTWKAVNVNLVMKHTPGMRLESRSADMAAKRVITAITS